MILYDQYKSSIMEMLSIDEETLNVLKGEYEERSLGGKRKAQLLFLLYVVLAIVSKLLFCLKGVKQKFNINGHDFVFISCPDTIFRTKTIDIIAHGLKYQVIYLPTFHLRAALNYHKFFKGTVDAVFMTISVKDAFCALKTIRNRKVMRIIKNSLSPEEYYSFWCQMYTYLVYDNFTKRRFGKVEDGQTKWIFEHQKFYFVPIVHMLKGKGIETVMLQHGCFFKPSYNYIPLYCDKVLCCSEREKEMYIRSGVSSDRVMVFGAPLQSIVKDDKAMSMKENYDLLILLTASDLKTEKQKMVLRYIKNNYPNLKTLIRFRPRSRRDDNIIFQKDVEGFFLSDVGVSLQEDVRRCKKVISFSEDATFCLIENAKQFVVVSPSEDNSYHIQNIAPSDDCLVEINKLLSSDGYTQIPDAERKFIFGETNVQVLNNMFCEYIRKH